MPRKYRVGNLLINAYIPKDLWTSGELDNATITKTLTDYAKKYPDLYAANIAKIKNVGDMFATLEGLSVTLNDITPQYKEREQIFKKYRPLLNKAKDNDERYASILIDIQNELKKVTAKNKGNLGLQVRSRGRGNVAQLMKGVNSPVVVPDRKGAPVPMLIERSYAEGLRPEEAYIAGVEARQAVIQGKMSTAGPGDVSKTLASEASDLVVTMPDCGTDNGINDDIDDDSAINRLLAHPALQYKKDTPVTREMLADLRRHKVKEIIVRSALTCEAPQGICQKCAGLDAYGQFLEIGDNVGERSAQAMSEPLTQMVLDTKHSTGVVKKKKTKLEGYEGIKQIMSVPKNFQNKAVVSHVSGTIKDIIPQPQGGWNVEIKIPNSSDPEIYYVDPNRKIIVKKGQTVKPGDKISDGVLDPRDVARHFGIGGAREYMTKTVHEIYGKGIDRRHVENLMSKHINAFRVEKDPTGKLLRGSIVNLDKVKEVVKSTPVVRIKLGKEAVGKTLAEPIYWHPVGTYITEPLIEQLKKRGIASVKVSTKPFILEPKIMPFRSVPGYKEDPIATMSHKYIKKTIIDAANEGRSSDIHGYEPMPAYVYGAEIRRKDPTGKY